MRRESSAPRIQTPDLPLPSSVSNLPPSRLEQQHHQSADVARAGDDERVGAGREDSQVADEEASRVDAGGEGEAIEDRFVLCETRRRVSIHRVCPREPEA